MSQTAQQQPNGNPPQNIPNQNKQAVIRQAGQQQMSGQSPQAQPGPQDASRKQKFMNQQLQPSPINAQNNQNGKHKVNLSADANAGQSLTQLQQNHSKHIPMNGLPYDKMKGLTPVSNKSGQGPQMKNGMHLQGPLAQFTDTEDHQRANQPGSNTRNPNHNRMPSLPTSIKGSIGNMAAPGQLNIHQNRQKPGQGVHPGMPLNIAANDITFAQGVGGYNQIRKFGGAQGGQLGAHGQKLMQLNLNGGTQGAPGQHQGHNFVVQGGGNQTQKQQSLGNMLKQQNYGSNSAMDRHQVPGMRMSPDQKYINNQALQQKRAKAHSGLAQFNNQPLAQSGPGSQLNLDKQSKLRQQRVRSQLGQHQAMPLDSVNVVQQSSSQQKHQNVPLNQQVLNNFMQHQANQRQESRKSNGASSAAGGRRRQIESPEMFRNVANQSLSQQQKLPSGKGQGTPLRNGGVMKRGNSRPTSAQSKGNNQMKISQSNQPQANNKTGQSLQGLNIHGLGQGQGLQGVQTTSQKLRIQQQMQGQDGGAQEGDPARKSGADGAAPAQGASKSQKISNVVTKFSFATKGGIAAHNPYKTNQDAYITSPHIMGLKHCHFFSVCDGHGQNGREVSGLLKHRLPFHVENQMKKNLGHTDSIKDYPQPALVYQSLKEAFTISQQEVCDMAQDTRYSGSTCVSVMTLGRKLYMANVGDSRGIVIKQILGGDQSNPGSQCSTTPLTRDHKPDDEDEAKRIIANNGRIDSYRDQHGNPLGPLRVWLKSEDVPGLAMTRSFGDAVAHSVGCNAEPEMNEYTFTKDDKVVVIASDGVWEFLENIDVAKIVYPFYLQKNAEGAAENLVRASFKRWKKEESVIDDITCIVIFLDVK